MTKLFTIRYLLKRNENHVHKNVYIHVYICFICNNPKLETQISINTCINKLKYIHTMKYHTEKGMYKYRYLRIHRNLNYAELKKLEYPQYDSICTKL